MSRYVMALDQGTTSSRAILFDRDGAVVAVDQHEFPQHFPKPGWVEHDRRGDLGDAAARARAARSRKAGATRRRRRGDRHHQPARDDGRLGSRARGEPIHRAIVWQSRQTAPICDALRARGLEDEVRARTGLVIDAYFSGTKVRFILDAVPGAQQRAERGELAFGTVDSWLLHQLTRGRVHATEYSNASRTLLYDIHARDWDERAARASSTCRARCCPRCATRAASSASADPEWFGAEIPIAGIAGDQQAALFGQGCSRPGPRQEHLRHRLLPADEHRAAQRRARRTGLLTTIAWGLGGTRSSTRSRAACSSPAPRCSGCATGSA